MSSNLHNNRSESIVSQGKLKIWMGVGAYVLAGVASTAIVTHSNLVAAESDRVLTMESVPNGALLAQGGEGAPPAPGAEGYKPEFQSKISGKALLKELRKGGHVIYIRHAQTDKDYADQADPKLDLTNCGTQRTLSDKGWKQAKSIGSGFRKAKIPVGSVFSSDYCRSWQTADLAFGTYQRTSALNFVKAEEYTPAQRLEMKTAVMPFLTAMPKPKTNTVLVGHDDVFESAVGIYPKPQGMAYILKPDGRGGVQVLANMPAEGWMMLGQ
jgi:phosphohistidine phosphatase SixA